MMTILRWVGWLIACVVIGLIIFGQLGVVEKFAAPPIIAVAALVSLAVIVYAVAALWKAVRYAIRGYDLTFHGRSGVIYKDRRGTVYIDGEMLIGPGYSYVIWTSSMKVTKPGTRTELDEAWRSEIIERIELSVGLGKLDIG